MNPSDFYMIAGVDAIKPRGFPAIGGNEGVAEVFEISKHKKDEESRRYQRESLHCADNPAGL
jgi:hypothetical protein